ncbi:hypothetical protein [Psychrobacillus sp. NPDC096623]|uniref:hypothetical protein n=1 Tax=Psychrobacillus sp. NPDC096623 TaxID=3364492 RepID=UPI0037FA3A8A
MNIIYKELIKLMDDYYKCDSMMTKELILSDIKLLTEALLHLDAPTLQLFKKLL